MNKINKILILLMLITASASIASATTITVPLGVSVDGLYVTATTGTGNSASATVTVNGIEYHIGDVVNGYRIVSVVNVAPYGAIFEKLGSDTSTPIVTQPSTPGANIISSILAWLKSIFPFLPW